MLQLSMHWGDWLDLFSQYLLLSVLSIGGGITTAPEMHRYLVNQQHWLTEPQFNASIAIAQAAPGPNILFVALMGWQVGLNAGGMLLGLLGMTITMLGILLPSTTITYLASRWGHRNRELRAIRAFKQGMAPIVVGLLISTAWVLASANNVPSRDWPLWVVGAATAILVWRTKIHVLWFLALGAVLGAMGVV